MSILLNPLPGSPRPAFPLRVAGIDVGSNAIRFIAAEFSARDRYEQLESIREPIRMGHETFLSGFIPADLMDEGVAAIERFRETMDALEIRAYRAVATSAVRDSLNGGEFVERVWEKAGLRVETITGPEEARLVWLAIRPLVDLGDGQWVLVDLGGGSVEVSLIDSERMHWSESHLLGTVRLLEELADASEESPEQARRMLEDHAAMLRISAIARGLSTRGMIATGGNIETLAELAKARTDSRGVSRLPLPRLHAVMEEIAELSPKERIKQLGLREDRADVILPAAIVYERVATYVGAPEIVVPNVGVKEGLLYDVLEDVLEHGAHEERLQREAIAGAIAVAQRYDFETAHAHQVTRLALDLFDQLEALHRLGSRERRILAVAGLLHDIGQFISYRRHHKHSFYLISHAELPGFTPAEIGLVALVARYHRRAEPKDSHEGYADLDGDDRAVVDRLASILRIADALDRAHQQQVKAVTAMAHEKEQRLVLEIEGEGDLMPERWALRKKGQLFEKVFGLSVRTRTLAESVS